MTCTCLTDDDVPCAHCMEECGKALDLRIAEGEQSPTTEELLEVIRSSRETDVPGDEVFARFGLSLSKPDITRAEGPGRSEG